MANSNINSLDMFNASLVSYQGDIFIPMGSLTAQGYRLDIDFNQGSAVFTDTTTGFSVVALTNDKGDRVVAFTGTQPGGQDAWADVNLGWEQWTGNSGQNRQIVMEYISNTPSGSTVRFTGHSLANDGSDNAVRVDVSYFSYGNVEEFSPVDTRINSAENKLLIDEIDGFDIAKLAA